MARRTVDELLYDFDIYFGSGDICFSYGMSGNCGPKCPEFGLRDGCTDMAKDPFYVCPVCGETIDPEDGEDNGCGERRFYWYCYVCKSSGSVFTDRKGNEFVRHEIE